MPQVLKDNIDNAISVQVDKDRANEIYLAFCGSIDHAAAGQLLHMISSAVAKGFGHVHLLFQSNGGSVADGMCLYNFFRGLPIKLTAYNTGTIRSAGVLAYLGAKYRKASQHATFVLHHCRRHNESGSANQMKAIANGLLIEQTRMETVLRTHLNLSAEQWFDFDQYELVLTPEQALQAGLATEIAEFVAPCDASFYPLEAVKRLENRS
jgi:ATP-dependent protease ClpP protease subunit